MEFFAKNAALFGLLNLGFALFWIATSIFEFRKAMCLSRETLKDRPLILDDKVAVMRPGDTVLLMLPLNDMTLDQQTRMVDSTKRMAERAGALGIEFIALPDWGQKAIVVSRSALPEHQVGCGADSAVI
jgi:hypothetical protein